MSWISYRKAFDEFTVRRVRFASYLEPPATDLDNELYYRRVRSDSDVLDRSCVHLSTRICCVMLLFFALILTIYFGVKEATEH